jgi:hypothetical protein
MQQFRPLCSVFSNSVLKISFPCSSQFPNILMVNEEGKMKVVAVSLKYALSLTNEKDSVSLTLKVKILYTQYLKVHLEDNMPSPN